MHAHRIGWHADNDAWRPAWTYCPKLRHSGLLLLLHASDDSGVVKLHTATGIFD